MERKRSEGTGTEDSSDFAVNLQQCAPLRLPCAYIFFFVFVRLHLYTFARIQVFVIPMCFIHGSFAFARRDSSTSSNDEGKLRKEKEKDQRETTTQKPPANVFLFVLFRTNDLEISSFTLTSFSRRLSFLLIDQFCNPNSLVREYRSSKLSLMCFQEIMPLVHQFKCIKHLDKERSI